MVFNEGKAARNTTRSETLSIGQLHGFAYWSASLGFLLEAIEMTGQVICLGLFTDPPGAEPTGSVATAGTDRGDEQLITATLQIRSLHTDIMAVWIVVNADMVEGLVVDFINMRIESGSAPDPALQVPAAGLREWLRADKIPTSLPDTGVSTEITVPFASWPDESGKGSDAVPAMSGGSGNLTIAGSNCTPAVSFSGPSTVLNFTLPINGWTGMTVFMAAQAAVDAPGWWQNQALIWNESQQWGTTFFTPSQTDAFFRFGTTQVNNQPIYSRPVNVGGDFSLTTAIHDSSVDSLYVNGLLALRQKGKDPTIAGTLHTAVLGAGLLGSYFTGNIGEILIYDRALSSDEREVVEHYLISKYGIH
jgi:Concanavalin A-like lectin/glucanases superfamily